MSSCVIPVHVDVLVAAPPNDQRNQRARRPRNNERVSRRRRLPVRLNDYAVSL